MLHAEHRWSTCWEAGHTWALVLAAGDGSRLQALTTTTSGISVPKQFCSLGGGASLLHGALRRARVVAPPERTCAVVAEHHRRWWSTLSQSIPDRNIIVQPRNRGTANGILLPLLEIVYRDPGASILVLPSDHYVRDEAVLATSVQQVMAQIDREHDRIVLLGLEPEQADPELGYIVPAGDAGPGVRAVSEFIEKPSVASARALIERGGLWNSFIFAASGSALLRAFEARCPQIIRKMRGIVASSTEDATRQAQLAELYEELPTLDFSRHVVEPCATELQVFAVPPCGWSDLGTPGRVAAAVGRERSISGDLEPAATHTAGFLDLAAQHLRRQVAG